MAGTSRDEGRIPTYIMLLDCLATKTRILTCSDQVSLESLLIFCLGPCPAPVVVRGKNWPA